jgi:predicted homoserine dehydrogenase-like protein
MVLFNDIIMAPIAGPVVEVITCAKTPLKAGQKLDGIGQYLTYGQCENAVTARELNLVPIGLAEGSIVKRDLPRDHVLSFDDIELPAETQIQRLYKEQCAMFFPQFKHDVITA